ncbi:L-arabinose isomerase [Coriobacterium glomerans PW2]|uniref:L-arabinose isomerase n=1 Tax=Coriobacterium glomerans (strain ATCC 49209 / DSM 20642 / JCM 10262 / PW2) TaxID=700015 RepID=F2NAF4_CORGP|nr:L-arabinose isomerase [Coriobacterium glomerans]AEB06481.1 L-arabinose isomerase [Coriobacterium glomerans PW2]
MLEIKRHTFWFCPCSQDLYGETVLEHVREHAREVVDALNATAAIPFEVQLKPTLITSDVIEQTFHAADADEECAGIITWAHTFSPSKSYILGLRDLRKPLCQFATQYNEEIPYDTIDMDFMNENQAAHGEREFGHIFARMRKNRKVVFGFWKDPAVLSELGAWQRVAVGLCESKNIRVARFADTMRNVAVTDGDKIEAEVKFGWTVDAWPVNELVPYVDAVSPAEASALADEYYDAYGIILDGRDPAEFRAHVEVQAAQEIGIERFLVEHGYNAFSDHFGDLGGLKQLPSLAVQRLMQKGYGFGPEGDWKTPAMVRLMKIMTAGDPASKGSALMEDYTYNLVAGREGILESHMAEVDPSVADGPVSIRECPLSMGEREDPARLVFTSKTGPAIATSLIDLGDRFRLIINAVDCKRIEEPMPLLPTGTVFWTPRPNLKVASTAWMYAGGAHHTAFSFDLTVEQMVDWAAEMGVEAVVIDEHTTIEGLRRDLMLGEVCFR